MMGGYGGMMGMGGGMGGGMMGGALFGMPLLFIGLVVLLVAAAARGAADGVGQSQLLVAQELQMLMSGRSAAAGRVPGTLIAEGTGLDRLPHRFRSHLGHERVGAAVVGEIWADGLGEGGLG